MRPIRIAIPEPTATNLEYTRRNWPEYAHAVERFGAEAVCIPLGAAPDVQAQLLTGCSAAILPGSPADVNPQKYAEERIAATAAADYARESADELVLQDAFNLHKPVLGICYGLQSMNVWKGGSLIQDLASGVNHAPGREFREVHALRVLENSRFAELVLPGSAKLPCWTNSSHHQAVLEVGGGLKAVAWSEPDGVIEAVEGAGDPFVLGVQWHPERTIDGDPHSRAIFEAFVAAARDWLSRTEPGAA